MSTRKIKIYSTLGVQGTIETDVQTFGELKPILQSREVNLSGMKVLVGKTKNELSENAAVLPTEDFKIYLIPSKTKSGTLTDSERQAIADSLVQIANVLTNGGVRTESSTKKAVSQEDQDALDDIAALTGGTSFDDDDYEEGDDDLW